MILGESPEAEVIKGVFRPGVEVGFNLPKDIEEGLREVALVDGHPATLPEDLAQVYVPDASREYVTSRQNDPSFPEQLAGAEAKVRKEIEDRSKPRLKIVPPLNSGQ